MKKAILKSLMILAATLPSFAWAAVQSGEPASNFSDSFDGSASPTGWFTSWAGEVPPESAYVDTRFGGGFTIYFESNSNKAHPYHGHNQGQDFTVAVCADISDCAVESGKGRVLWALGSTGDGVALVKTASTTVQVWQDGSPVAGLTYSSDTLASGSHLFIVGNDSTGSYLVVDRAKVTGDALDDPADGFQIGSVYGGIDGTNYLRGSGTVIDEVRGYNTKLSDADCTTLANLFAWSGEPWASWTGFATLTGSLKPIRSSTQREIDGGTFTFNLGSGVVNEDGSLTTTGGTGTKAPYIALTSDFNVGYNNPITFLVTAEMPETVTGVKPLWYFGSDATANSGIGFTVKSLSSDGITFGGSWGNTVDWSGTNTGRQFTSSIKPKQIATFVVTTDNSGLTLKIFSNGALADVGRIASLMGSSIAAPRITFGNVYDTGTNTITYRILDVAIFPGTATVNTLADYQEMINGNYQAMMDNLQQYYPFENSNNESGLGKNPVNLNWTYVGTENPFGAAYGNGLGANATSKGGINTSSDLVAVPGSKDFTAAFWYKLTALPSGNKLLLSRGATRTNPGGGHGWSIFCTSEGKLVLSVYDDTAVTDVKNNGTLKTITSENAVFTATSLAHYIVWTREGRDLKLYADGACVATGSFDADNVVIGYSGAYWYELRVNGQATWENSLLAEGEAFDELAFWDVALNDLQVAALQYRALPYLSVSTGIIRDLDTTDETWSTPSEWPDEMVPGEGDSVTLNVSVEGGSTLNLDTEAKVADLTVKGNKLTVTGSALTSGATVVNADTDVSGITASLGAVTINSDKTLTGLVGKTTYASLSGEGTYAFGTAAADTEYSQTFSNTATTPIKWTQGQLLFTAGGNGSGYPKNAPLTVTGENAKIILKTNTDTTGYSGGSAPLTIADGATLGVEARDTFNRLLVLNNAKVTFSGDDLGSGRSFDFYSNSSITSTGTSTIGGATATNDATYGDPTVASGIIAIRRSNMTFTVTNEADTLTCYAAIGQAAGNGGTINKAGAGTLALYRAATTALPVAVNAGTLKLVNAGTMTTTGAYTIAQDATLAVSVKTDATKTMTNTFNGPGKIVKQEAGTLDLSGATFGETLPEFVLESGTLILPAGKEGTITVPAGATLKLVLSDAQLVTGYNASGVTNNGSFAFINTAGETILADNTWYKSDALIWTPTDETSTFETVSCWANGEVPAADEEITINTQNYAADIDVTVTRNYAKITVLGNNDHITGVAFASGVTAAPEIAVNGIVKLPIEVVNNTAVAISIADGSVLAADVADGAEANLTRVPAGTYAFWKTGEGTLTLNVNLSPANGTKVVGGTMKFGSQYIGSNQNSQDDDVTVCAGAVLDFAGKADGFTRWVTLEGGATLKNSGGAIGTGSRQLAGVILRGDATIENNGAFGLIAGGYGATVLTLNGYTLTKKGAGAFWICNTTIGAGKIKVDEGYFEFANDKPTTIANITLDVAGNNMWRHSAGTITYNGNITKQGKGTVTIGQELNGNKTIAVEGGTLELTAANKLDGSVSIASGAVLDISGETARLFKSDWFKGDNKLVVAGTLKTRAWDYGGALGALGSNAPYVKLDGGTVEFVEDNVSETQTRGFTVTDKGATLVIPEGGTYYHNQPANGNFGIKNSGTLTLKGKGTYKFNGAVPGTVEVASGTTLSQGTFATLRINNGSIIDTRTAVMSANQVLYPETIEKVSVILSGTPTADVKVLSATTFPVSLSVPADVYVGNATLPEMALKLESRADGLYLTFPKVYTRTFDSETDEWVKTGAWRFGDAVADEPPAFDSAEVTMAADTIVSIRKPITLTQLSLAETGTGRLTLEFDLSDLLTDDQYRAAPYTVKLLEVTEGFDFGRINLWVTGLRYGATVAQIVTPTAVYAKITLPEDQYTTTESISVNFTSRSDTNGEYRLSGSDPTGLGVYQVPADRWSQFSENAGDDEEVILVKADGTTGTARMSFNSSTTWAAPNAGPQLLKGYIDDGAPGAHVEFAIPEAWESYTAVIYVTTDTANTSFTAKRVNGTTYSYVDGLLCASEENWGSSESLAELREGMNTMVIPNLTDRTLTIDGLVGNSTTPRGCIAAVQVFYRKPNLIEPQIYKATLDGSHTWDSLWDADNFPTSKDLVELTLQGDSTLDITGLKARRVSVVGRSKSFTLTGTETEAAEWIFTTDTVLTLPSADALVPSFITAYPGTVRYTYNYTAPEGGFTTNPNYTTEFAAGFSGSVTPAGGGVNFSAGTVTLQKVNLSSVQTAIAFSGTSRTTAPESLTFSQTAVRVYGSAQVTSPALALADGEKGVETTFSIEDNAVVTVTGDQNDHNSTNAKSSLSLTVKEGSATLALSGNGRLIAEKAEMVLADSGDAVLSVTGNAEVRVKGLVHKHADAKTSIVLLRGGRLLVGESTFRTLTPGKTIGLTMGGGAIGALSGTIEWDSDADAAMTLADSATINFASEPGATLAITSEESAFLLQDEITNRSGGLRLGDLTLSQVELDIEGGTLEVAGLLDVASVTTGADAGISFDGGVLTVDTLTFTGNVTLTYPLRDRLSTGGYIVMRNGAVPDVSKAVISLVLDADRGDTEKLLPEYPLIIGACDTAATPTVRGVGLTNNSNGAITDHKLGYLSGDLGDGLYVEISGDEVLKVHTVELDDPTDGDALGQNVADAYPYHYFTATVEGARLKIPASGIALSHITFSGEATRIVSQATAPATMLHSNHISITSDLIFDLSAWTDEAFEAFIRGAVRDVPASTCLVASGITRAPGVTLSVDETTLNRLPDGFTAEIAATPDGIYLVVTAGRAARVLPVNFTTAEFPLGADPDKPGAYPIASTEWNSLAGSFSASSLLRTDASGIAIAPAADADGMPTQLLVYNSKAVTSDAASASMLKAWIRDTADQEILFANLPFAAYRVALIFSNDLEGAAYAPVIIGEASYCMDAEGYLRKNIAPYRETIPGDTQWGSTDFTETDSPFVPGHNILVTDVLTDPSLKIQLPASVYALTYSGLAALQIIEAPATVEVVTTDQYAYTFPSAGEYVLSTLDLTMNGGPGTGTWVNSSGNTLTLTSEHDVTVTLPEDFTAKAIILIGNGHITLQVVHGGGAQIGTLNASGATDVTVHFDCTGVAFTAPSGVMTFERGFNNNAQPYTIAADATLVLGEAFGGTTSLDVAAGVTPTLAIADASAGTLRRNYELQTVESYRGWKDLTLAFRSVNRAANPDNSSSHLLVEEGDFFSQPGVLRPAETADTWRYTQTGGTAYFGYYGVDGGFSFFDDATADQPKRAELTVSGGRLSLTQLAVFTEGSTIDLTLSGDATLELTGATFAASGDSVRLTVEGGRITTVYTETELSLPIKFTAGGPVELAPAAGAPLVLNAANSGTGSITVTQGTVAIAHASALGETTATIAGGATLEVRANAAAMADTAAMANALTFEEGSTLSVTAADGTQSVRIAGSHNLTEDNKQRVRYVLNDVFYTDVTVDAETGTVTFGTPAATNVDVVWNDTVAAGTWEEGLGTPWVDNQAYYNGVNVTFPARTAETKVTVRGALMPDSITWDDGSEDQYTFTAADSASLLTLEGSPVNMNSGLIWDIPVDTAVNAELQGSFNTYRLIGALSNGNKTATLVTEGENINGAPAQHGVWCTNGVTLAPKPGETQIVSAMANAPLVDGSRSHLTGSGDVIITGGGTVQFAGKVGAGSTTAAFQNKSFSGRIIVKDNSTLDFTMTREGVRPNYSFFAIPEELNGTAQTSEPSSGAPRYRDEGAVALSILDGGTVRFSGCRNVYGGHSNKDDTLLHSSRLIEVGCGGTVDFAHGDTKEEQQNVPYGFTLFGDGAKILASKNVWIAGGTTIKVSGIGDIADPATPGAELVSDPESEMNGKYLLTRGITAEIAGGETTGLVPWAAPATTDPLTLDVGEASTLNVSTLFPVGIADTHPGFTFKKTGLGRLAFTRPTQTMPVTLAVEKGILGGTTTFADAQVTMAVGTTLEAGLSIPRLTLADKVTLKVDPTGETVIFAEMATFAPGGAYTVASLIDPAEIPAATGRLPVKVMGWTGTQYANSASFVLDEDLEMAGYSLEVRADGLYLKQGVTFVRELDIPETHPEGVAYQLAWHASKAWYRLADLSRKPEESDKVMCDYAPDETDAATALFILPEAYAPQADGSTLAPPKMILILTREVAVARVRFAVWTKQTVDGIETETDVLHTLSVPVVYHYNLTNETMPGDNEAKSFTWMPTLVVENSNTATVTGTVPAGYAYSLRDATLVVYASATNPAINVNFTGAASGEASWVATDADPSGIVPFAGVYWNNASTEIGGGGDYLGGDDTHTVFLTRAVVAGVEPGEDNQAVTAEVTYLTAGAGSMPARRGAGNVTLVAGYLHGNRGKPKENNPVESEEAVIPSNEILASAGMDSADVESGWQVKVDSVPFNQYDLYLLFTGNTDDAVEYPAVRIKVGEEAWCTYSMVHGWAAPASRADSWNGTGGLVDGTFRDGMNVLHFRFSAPPGSAIQIAPADNSQADEAAAQAVGLAALQIVACTDGAANERLGTGKWSDAAGWRRTLADSTQETGRWLDATADAPRYAQIQTTSSLAADMVAQTPYLALSGTSTMRLLGTAGVLSTGTVDLRKVNPMTTIHFEEDVFADAPNVILAPDITFTLPEGAETRTNTWRWIYDEVDDSASAILQKRNSGDLIIARKMLNTLQIDDGTLWLSTQTDGAYDRTTMITGDGIFGKTGPGDLKMEWNLLRTTGASGGVIARCNQGYLYLVSRGEAYRQIQSLPAGTTVVAEGAGTIIFEAIQESLRQPFDNGIMKAVNGGTIRLRKATNMFANSFAPAVGFDWQKNPPPSARLESGRFYVEMSGGVHPHITGLTSTGNSSFYFDYNNAGAWSNEGLNLWSGRLEVESGNLGLHANTGHHNSLAIRAMEDFGHGDGSYIHVAGGATLYSDLPIQGGKDGANQLLHKTGAGIWVQTCSISPGNGNNGGNETRHASDITIHEGTFRLNLGADIFAQYPTSATRTITVKSGARMDGAGEIVANTHAYINTGATLASGIPDEWVGISSACPNYAGMPARFKQEPGNSIHRLFFRGNVIFADDAILEIDLAESALLAIGTPSFGSNLIVRLKNLPATLTKDVQLTDFTNGPADGAGPMINCPEALALDAEVVWENGNLWLKPSEAAYVWANQDGNWSEEKWSFGGSTVAFPYSASMKPSDETAGVARIQALTAPVVLAVDKGLDTSDGRNWPLKALILSAEQPITISELLGTVPDPLPADFNLNTLHVESTVWKLGDGKATVSAPIAFFSTGAASMLNVVKGDLTLTHPLTLLNASGSLTTLPTAIEILKGASLTYALAATDADPLTQTLSGPVTGEGTLVVNQAGTQVTLTGSTDNGVNYDVQAGTLIVAPATPIAQAETTLSRKVTVAAGAALELNAETALGWSKDINWTLTAGSAAEGTAGAMVRTSADARVRGTVTVVKPDSATGAVTAALGTGNTSLDGDFTAIVPEGAVLNLGGIWQTPVDCLAGTVTKRGAGELCITGTFGSNLPVTVAEGSVRVTGSVYAGNLNDATVPDWTVETGAALVAATSGFVNVGDGALTFRNGSLLNTVDQAPKFLARGGIHFEDGAHFELGEASMTAVQPAQFQSAATVNGVIIVDLDRLDPERLSEGTHTLITFTSGRTGSGTFVLGGSKLVKWAEEGWSLRDNGDTVTFEPFGGSDGFYTWAGDDSAEATGAGNWDKPFWVARDGTEREAWPAAPATPSVTLQDTDPIDLERIPDAARTLEWTLPAQDLADFRCANNREDGADEGGDYTLTAAANAESPTLSVTGTFLKTGNAKLTVNRPVKLGKQSALNILGGETLLSGALLPASGNFENTVTVGGDATLRFSGTASRELLGLLDGDGTGTLANDSGPLTVASGLEALKALEISGGSVTLTAAEQYAVAPEVTLADGAVLVYAPETLSVGGEVMMSVNADATDAAGVLLWQAAANRETLRTPRLAAPADAGPGPAVNVAELRYAPESGHLILDPGRAVLPESATINLINDPSENDALWMGAKTDAGSDFVYSGLTGTGLLSVEPVIDPFAADAWARNRTFTLKLNPAADETARTFKGLISGAYTLAGEAITAGLTVLNAADADEARFTLTNSSTADTLGLLTVGERVRTEVTGSWAGDVTVTAGGMIAGGTTAGTLGAAGRTVTVPAGAAISASFYGRRQQTDGTFKNETIPATLTVNGTLSLESGSRLGVLLRKDLQGVQQASCVEADHLLLPTVLADGEEAVQVRVDLDSEANAYTRPAKILGWKTISGVGKINGTVYVDGQPTTDYILKQRSDGLYLQRSAARFWMILR